MKSKRTLLRLTGGSIVTMQTDPAVVGETIVEDARIVWFGRRGSAPTEYRRARTIDLQGRLLLPSFTDAHTHFLQFAQNLDAIDLRAVPTLTSAQNRIRQYVKDRKAQGGWVIGNGFSVNLWGQWPTKHDLDRACPDRPAVIWSHDNHALWINSKAMERCKITHDSENPAGGVIVRDDTGEPNGILLETAYQIVWDKLPRPTRAAAERMIKIAQAHAHSVGVTALGDVGQAETLSIFQSLRNKGQLGIRLWKSIALRDLDRAIELGLASGVGDSWIMIGSVKIFLDGALGSQTAWMYKPYTGNRTNKGISRLEPERFEAIARRAAAHGFSLCVHAIGDSACGQAIDVLGKYQDKFPSHHPPRIEHLQVLSPADLKRIAGTRIIASMQPSHLLTDRDVADRHWGTRARLAFAFRSLWDNGIRMAFGSDVPIEPLRPLDGIGAAVYRSKPNDRRGPWIPRQRLSVWEAVWAFTVGGAIATGQEGKRGRIAAGQPADLVILDRDIFKVEPKEIFDTAVDMTIVDGKIVFDRLA